MTNLIVLVTITIGKLSFTRMLWQQMWQRHWKHSSLDEFQMSLATVAVQTVVKCIPHLIVLVTITIGKLSFTIMLWQQMWQRHWKHSSLDEFQMSLATVAIRTVVKCIPHHHQGLGFKFSCYRGTQMKEIICICKNLITNLIVLVTITIGKLLFTRMLWQQMWQRHWKHSSLDEFQMSLATVAGRKILFAAPAKS
jgi:hypothetical protein